MVPFSCSMYYIFHGSIFLFGVYGCFFFSPCGLWGVYGGFAPMPPNVDKMWLNVDFVCISVGFFVPLY